MLCDFWDLVIKDYMTSPWLSLLSSSLFSFSSPSSAIPLPLGHGQVHVGVS